MKDNNNNIKLIFENYFENDKKIINDNLSKKETKIEDNFSFRNTLNNNKKTNNSKTDINNNNNLNYQNIKSDKKEKINQDMLDFCNIIKSNTPNIFKINSFEKQHSQKNILRLKLEAFLVIKKYYLHRKSKSGWIKRKKKLEQPELMMPLIEYIPK